jgi:hypothetical protein
MALVLLLAAILSTTAVLAASGPGTQPRRSVIASVPIDLVSQLWGFLTRVWSKNGSEMDPSGVQTKNGSEVDPDGVRTKNGSEMDPDGHKLQILLPVTTNQDNGHQVDPNG